MSHASDLVRAQFKKGDDIRDAGLTTPEDIVRYDDIAYASEDGRWQRLDVYRPRFQDGETLPVIVSVHGGAWVYGDKERYQFYCMSLAQRGFAVVNFSYRLAPEYKFPASLEDTNTVFAWILEHAAQYHFDTAHIFAVGDSAGAHLLGLYAAVCTNPHYASRYAFSAPEGFAPTAVALNCGKYVIRKEPSDPLSQMLMADLLPRQGSTRELASINVLRYITPQFPPVFLMTSNADHLRSQAPLMVKTLIEKQVPFQFGYYGDMDHPLDHVFHCNMKLDAAAQCNDDECAFFRRFL